MFQSARLGFGFVELGEDVGGAPIETLAGFGEAERARGALEEGGTERCFEILHAARDSRLAKFKIRRCAREAARIRDTDEQAHCINPVQDDPPHAIGA